MKLQNYLLNLTAGLILLSSCTKHPKTPQEVAAETPFDTTSLLKYNPEKADKRIDAFMQNLHKHNGFNGNVLVAKGGKILYENSFGWANYLTRDSLKLNSQFELASVSKTMTGTAILMLMEQGKLKLDQNVKDFFPNFP
ncbi:MAG: class A beta-lactamase-related serine hydrolase, partial [Sphingobacteriaceae bacterium]